MGCDLYHVNIRGLQYNGNLEDLRRVHDREEFYSCSFCSKSLEHPEVIQIEIGAPLRFEGLGQSSKREVKEKESLQIENGEKIQALHEEDNTEPEDED